jgi:hypothetical protein
VINIIIEVQELVCLMYHYQGTNGDKNAAENKKMKR